MRKASGELFCKIMRIVLGSISKDRQAILKKLGYEFEVFPSGFDEKSIRAQDPRELSLLLARAKADSILAQLQIQEQAILITVDQVVACGGFIHEKPADESEVRLFYERYARLPFETVTSVTVTRIETHKRAEGIDVVRVSTKPIPQEVVETLIHKGEIFHRAGGFSIQDPVLREYVLSVNGEEDSVLGLPPTLTKNLIEQAKSW